MKFCVLASRHRHTTLTIVNVRDIKERRNNTKIAVAAVTGRIKGPFEDSALPCAAFNSLDVVVEHVQTSEVVEVDGSSALSTGIYLQITSPK